MEHAAEDGKDGAGAKDPSRAIADRKVRADAQRSLDALLQAAKTVFASSGVDAPVREIADRAGVGIGTVYRHFPQRAKLIAAVFRREMDSCADAAPVLAAEHGPFEALAHWMQRYVTFVATKRGLASALHSGDPAYDGLMAHFEQRLRPAFRSLFDRAAAAGQIRAEFDPDDLLMAVMNLCRSSQDGETAYAERMVALLMEGLRYRSGASTKDAAQDATRTQPREQEDAPRG